MASHTSLAYAEKELPRLAIPPSAPAPEPPATPPRVPRYVLVTATFGCMDLVALISTLLLALPVAGLTFKFSSLVVLLGLALMALGGLYRQDTSEADELKRRVGAFTALTLSMMAFAPALPIMSLALFWVAGIFLGTALRMWIRTLPSIRGLICPPLLLLGLGVERDSFAYRLRASSAGQAPILRGVPLRALAGRGKRGLRHWLRRLAGRANIPLSEIEIVLLPAPAEVDAAHQISRWLQEMGLRVKLGIADGAAHRGGSGVQDLGADLLFTELGPEMPPRAARVVKRGIDIVLTLTALTFLAPLFGLICLGLAREGGPVFFRQKRLGQNGRRFTCFKFRTMRPDAEDRLRLLLDCNPAAQAEWALHQKLDEDPRITPLGRILRVSSLDELPQLFNILRGEMSLVGPRPIIAPEVPGYAADHDYFRSKAFDAYARCVPGLTGLWQICGRHQTAHTERVRLDGWYARHWSIWLDLVILLRTFRVVIAGDGR